MSHESTYISKVHGYLPKTLFIYKTQGMMRGGIPDVYYAGPKDDAWVEYKKIPALPKRENTLIRPALSSLQKNALRKLDGFYIECRVAVYVESTKRYLIFQTPDDWENGAVLDSLTIVKGHKGMAQHILNMISEQ